MEEELVDEGVGFEFVDEGCLVDESGFVECELCIDSVVGDGSIDVVVGMLEVDIVAVGIDEIDPLFVGGIEPEGVGLADLGCCDLLEASVIEFHRS